VKVMLGSVVCRSAEPRVADPNGGARACSDTDNGPSPHLAAVCGRHVTEARCLPEADS
jgi:hypothetical protein